jgi:NAD(P)H-nitrite reductase
MQVTLLHRGPHLMDQQLDEQAGDLLYDRLSLRGIKVILQAETASFAPDTAGNIRAVNLHDGREIPAERVVIAVGVRPEIGLAKQAGLSCDRGIQVDNQLQTSDPQISAIGECCQLGDLTFGLVAPCWQQAKTLASRLAGIDSTSTFERQNVPLRLKVTGIDLFCAGELNGDDDAQIHTTFDPFDGHYRRLVLRDNQVKGVLLWGDISDGPDYLFHISHPTTLQAPLSVFSPAHEPETSGLPFNQSEPLPVAVTRSHSMSKPVLVMAGHGMVGHHFYNNWWSANCTCAIR